MAGVFQKNNKKVNSGQEWRATGSFMRKPSHGWPQSDDKLIHGGVTYSLRYVGNVEVKQSMRTLHFDMRGQVTKEAVFNVCKAIGLRIGDKKRKVNKTAAKILGDCDVRYGSANVEMNVSTKAITITFITTGQIISCHEMQTISFASGGDTETKDYVSYVAKDPNRRACYVLECPEGMADQVIATIGQAFEIRFKSYLQNPPKAIAAPDKLEEPIFGDVSYSAWGEEPEYYNNIEKLPPPPPQANYQMPNSIPVDDGDEDGRYSYVKEPLVPKPNPDNKSDGVKGRAGRVTYDNVDLQPAQSMETDDDEFYDKLKSPLHDFDDSIYSTANAAPLPPITADNQAAAQSNQSVASSQYSFQSTVPFTTNQPAAQSNQSGGGDVYSFQSAITSPQSTPLPLPMSSIPPPAAGLPPPPPHPSMAANAKSMESQYSFQTAGVRVLPAAPATSTTVLPQQQPQQQPKPPPAPRPHQVVSENEPVYSSGLVVSSLENEEWFHGPITRKQSEELLEEDGDFLVREKIKGQYVLSGMQKGQAKHLMLIDPNGIVRTKDQVFHSVSHLVSYHRDNKLPIVSAGSTVRLINPVFCELRAVYSGSS